MLNEMQNKIKCKEFIIKIVGGANNKGGVQKVKKEKGWA